MKKLFFILVIVIVNVGIIEAQTLFHIARSLNKNVVNYDVQLNGNSLDKKNPVHVYWYNLEKHPVTTNELNFIQRKMAYGYKTISASDAEAVIRLKAYKERTFHICKFKGQWVAIVPIANKNCILQEIYAHSPSKMSCDWIELRGKDIQTGQFIKERINN